MSASVSTTLGRAAIAVVDKVRQHVAVRSEILRAAKDRRNLVRELAVTHPAARAGFNSGSVAHGTVNAPIRDSDCGVVLNRRKFPKYGPDGDGIAPLGLLESFRDWILPQLRKHYPAVTCEITKRALLFEFHETLAFEGGVETDPSVDLIVALDRREVPGLWIPNTEQARWDSSHPQRHTELFLDTEDDLRVHRARVIRLAKVAIKNDAEAKVMCSFNIEALALSHVTEVDTIAPALAAFLRNASDAIARSLTDDPAHVSGAIRLPEGVTQARAADRLAELTRVVDDSLAAESELDARRILREVFGRQLEEMSEQTRQELRSGLRLRDTAAVSAAIVSPRLQKPRRSYGHERLV